LNDLETAKAAEAKLAEEAADGSATVKISHKELSAAIKAHEGDGDTAISLMDEAIEIALGQRLPNGAANPIKPPYELYGEILMGLGRSKDALEKFEASLLRMPKRTHSLLGAAEAAAASGDSGAAKEHYATLLEFWQGSSQLPGIEEAKQFTTDGQE